MSQDRTHEPRGRSAILKVIRITKENESRYVEGIAALEHLMTYPLGEDRFRIDHGEDYFAFFRRLGQMHYYVGWDTKAQRVVSVACGILRDILVEGKSIRTWYQCDLKVHPDFRNQRIPLRMLRKIFLPAVFRCRRAYSISMNDSGQKENRILRLLQKFPWIPFSHATTLNLYSCSFEEFSKVQSIVEGELGPVGFISLGGIKDIVLQSTGNPMPLLHMVNKSNTETGWQEAQPGATHMFCTPHDSNLARRLEKIIPINATATVIQTGMPARTNWQFVQTSEI